MATRPSSPGFSSIPPPPAGFEAASRATPFEARSDSTEASRPGAPRAKGHPFSAELDVSELDDRDRPASTWSARARLLSRSSLVFLSRRMCYTGRYVAVKVHLVDASPVPLFGRVASCDYEAEGRYRVELELLPLPPSEMLREWYANQ